MTKHDLIIWEPSLSPHKIGLFAALEAHPRIASVTQVVHEGLLSERADMGWDVSGNRVQTIVAPTVDEIEQIVRDSAPDAIHIFSGMHWLSTLVEGLKAVQAYGRRFGIMSEPRASEGPKGMMRRLHSIVTERAIRRKAGFVLAIGANGPDWFTSTGFNKARVFPFAYFLPLTPAPTVKAQTDKISIAYVGRLIEAKGFGLFLQSLPHLKNVDDIAIAGVGDMADHAQEVSQKMEMVRFLGKLPMAEVPDLLQSVDILVQPSLTTDDGWAAIVGEALMSGAAVVATHKVGASICLHQASNGAVLRELTPQGLARLIYDVALKAKFTPEGRSMRRAWAAAHISADAGAANLVDILDHLYEGKPRPYGFYEAHGDFAR